MLGNLEITKVRCSKEMQESLEHFVEITGAVPALLRCLMVSL